MAKEKTSKAVQNKHIYARASYLYQAAAYLSAQGHGNKDVTLSASTSSPVISKDFETVADNFVQDTPSDTQPPASSTPASAQTTTTAYATQPHGSPRHLLTHLRGICLKSQVRLSQDIKRSICKRCNVLLVPGKTCAARVENASKGGKKEWADVYVVRCLGCGGVKGFPVGMRQKGRGERGVGKEDGKVVQGKKKGQKEEDLEEDLEVVGSEVVHEKLESGNEIVQEEIENGRVADERESAVVSNIHEVSGRNTAEEE